MLKTFLASGTALAALCTITTPALAQAATDAATDMVDGLTLMLNKARQESITTELLDIVGGVAALEA